ncbi:MAG: hypothetical protein M0P19_08700, partial [Nevskia sp.]|nr:hypothetical protein [Nevskia sp.]
GRCFAPLGESLSFGAKESNQRKQAPALRRKTIKLSSGALRFSALPGLSDAPSLARQKGFGIVPRPLRGLSVRPCDARLAKGGRKQKPLQKHRNNKSSGAWSELLPLPLF